MLFNIYLATILANLVIDVATFGAFLIKTKIYGYKWCKSLLPKEAIIGIVVALIIDGILPILNIISVIQKLRNFNSNINEFMFKFKQKGVIYDNYSIFNDEKGANKEENLNEKIAINELVMKAKRHGDTSDKELIESMYLEGVSEIEIKNELKNSRIEIKNSKKERAEILKKDKNDKAQKFGNDMVDETELNCELSLKEKAKLLKLYKKALLSKRSNIKPIKMAEKISTKNYIKTNKRK